MKNVTVTTGGIDYKVVISWNYENRIRDTHFFKKGQNLIQIFTTDETAKIKGYVIGSGDTFITAHKGYGEIFQYAIKNLLN